MSQLSLLSGLTIVETTEGAMVIRSLGDIVLQKRFDDWYEEKGFTISTQSETRKTKILNWDSKRTAKCWKFFIQGAMAEDGRPVVRCVVCGDVLFHGGFFGPSAMSTHLKKGKHIMKAKELVYGSGKGFKEPTTEEILDHLKNTGNEGLLVRTVPLYCDTMPVVV